jgi:hypothetical protein
VKPQALNLHHLYRAMAFLGSEIKPKGKKGLGTPRCLKDLIQEDLFERRRDLFTEVKASFPNLTESSWTSRS